MIPLIALAASGCGSSGGAPSEQQNRELHEAERMLDEAPNSLSGIDENMLLDSNQPQTAEPPRQ